MKCTFCGTENMPGRTHCIACGTPLAATESIVQPESPVVPMPESSVPVQETASPLFAPAIGEQPSLPPLGSSASAIESQPEVAIPEPFVGEQSALPPLGSSVSTLGTQSAEPLLGEEIALPSLPPVKVDEPVTVLPEPTSWLNNDSPSIAAQEASASVEMPRAGESPRVNVQFSDDEVAEVAMPIHAESSSPKPMGEVAASTPNEAGESAQNHTGPWLAIIVLVAAIGIGIWLIYFVYNLLFGGSAVSNVPVTNTPTSIVTPAPVTTTPVSTMTVNDTQREADIGDLRIALNAYYQGKQRYPAAGNYNSLLNALIGGGYLSRRVQDPAFPAQEYRYSVDSSGNSYDITVTFDTTASRLLGGSTSSVYHLRPLQ